MRLSDPRNLERLTKHALRRWRRALTDDRGATTLEYALLLAVIAIPSYFISTLALNLLVEHYRLMTLLNSLPMP